MSMRTQEELNQIWNGILEGKYGSAPRDIAPRRVPAEEGRDIMSIRNPAGTEVDVYERKRGGDWEVVPYVGQVLWPVVKRALENPKFKWRTVDGVVEETGLDQVIVSASIAAQTGAVIKSSIPDKHGRDLFTTRKHYHEKSSLLERLEAAITNKVQK